VLFCLYRTVLRQVLRQRQHQRLATVQHVDFLPLRFGKRIGVPYGITDNAGTQADNRDSEKPYLPEGCFTNLSEGLYNSQPT
jgi:hypothetical protein